MADLSPAGLAKQLLVILYHDRSRLERIDDYMAGDHDDPYMPQMADDEYKLLAKRAVSNWMPLVVSTPNQAMYVDSFRPGRKVDSSLTTPEWEHWQRSRMDARQLAVHRGALTFGHSFTVTTKVRGKVMTRGLSAMHTTALFEDPANDNTPYAALTVLSYPTDKVLGKATLWDGTREYKVSFKGFGEDPKVSVGASKAHGASECPVTRFAAYVDLEGRTFGLVEPLIPLQNRINQTIFDLLVTQTYNSFEVRTVTGMAPPLKMKPVFDDPSDPTAVTGYEPELDANGRPQPEPINHNARRFLFAEDEKVKFGSLPGSSLNGFIESVDMSIRHLSAIAQVPPHHLLGQIANLSAEALQAAETSLLRMVEELRSSFGESWERVFRLAGELNGVQESADDFAGEVVWRDMDQKSLAQSADALGKLADQLGIPKQGLWPRVPNVTENEIQNWKNLAEEEPVAALADAVRRSTKVDAAPPVDAPAFA